MEGGVAACLVGCHLRGAPGLGSRATRRRREMRRRRLGALVELVGRLQAALQAHDLEEEETMCGECGSTEDDGTESGAEGTDAKSGLEHESAHRHDKLQEGESAVVEVLDADGEDVVRSGREHATDMELPSGWVESVSMDVGVRYVGGGQVEVATQCEDFETDHADMSGESADEQDECAEGMNVLDFVYDRFRMLHECACEEGAILLRSELLASIDQDVRRAVDMWEQMDVFHWPGDKPKRRKDKERRRGGR